MKLKLFQKQGRAFKSKATEILYGGAAGGGKSYLMRVAAIVWCLWIPGLQVYIFRRTYPDLWKNHMEGPKSFPVLLAPFLLAGLVNINYGDRKCIEFGNGSKIFLCHCQYEKDMYNYQGAEIHVLLMDELTQFTDTIYRFLRGRVRMIGMAHKIPERFKGCFPRIINSSNPGGIGHNWVKAAFIDIAAAFEIKRMPKKEGGMLRQYVPARMQDNPALLEEDPDYEDRLEGLGNAALVRAMKLGDWDIVSGGMFDDVWDRNIHVLPKILKIPVDGYMDRSFDWGSSKPFSVGWWYETKGEPIHFDDHTVRRFPPGTLIRFAEWYGWNGEPNKGSKLVSKEIAEGIKQREKELGIENRCKPGPADSSIFDVVDDRSIAGEMEKAGVEWEAANKAAGTRKRGWEVMRTMLKASLAKRMEDPGLFVTENCIHFIRTVPVLPRDDRDPDDVDTKSEDHVGDESRYRAIDERREIIQTHLTGL